MSTNRTKWPVGGGAVGIQPGWFNGHSSALMYINLGHGTVPENYSLPMQAVFAIVGPSNELYPGSICIPQVPLPKNYTAVVGQNATIQIIEAAQHGAALYNVSQSLELQSLQPMLINTTHSAWISPLPRQKRCLRSTIQIAPMSRVSTSRMSTSPT